MRHDALFITLNPCLSFRIFATGKERGKKEKRDSRNKIKGGGGKCFGGLLPSALASLDIQIEARVRLIAFASQMNTDIEIIHAWH